MLNYNAEGSALRAYGRLKMLNVRDNPLINPPHSIVKKGFSEIGMYSIVFPRCLILI